MIHWFSFDDIPQYIYACVEHIGHEDLGDLREMVLWYFVVKVLWNQENERNKNAEITKKNHTCIFDPCVKLSFLYAKSKFILNNIC